MAEPTTYDQIQKILAERHPVPDIDATALEMLSGIEKLINEKWPEFEIGSAARMSADACTRGAVLARVGFVRALLRSCGEGGQ